MKMLSLLFTCLLPFLLTGQNYSPKTVTTADQVIQSIIKMTGSAIIPNTVDVIKEGDSSTPVVGIATCMFATMDVLKQAVSKGCNLIIAHEPVFYNHLDETSGLQKDAVYLEKKKYINDNHLVIWRFHDYIHSIKPDGILSGMIVKLGWKNYAVADQPNQFVFPETTLKGLLENLKKTFPKNSFYVVGNPEMKVKNVWLAEGAPGSGLHIHLLEKEDADVVITGESEQWETYEYARDAVSQGRNKAVIFLGHINSEEAGMDYCADWLKTIIKDIPVTFIECGPSYWSY
jgi:putative NIF3 family GTP cyclohydrolase 1 type 2